jgi:hypothetical protein
MLQAASDPNMLAQRIIHQAIKEKDNLTLWVLTGDPMRFVLAGLRGISQATLQRVAADARVAADPLAADPFYLNGGVAGYAFLKLQDGDMSCANLPTLAKAFYNAMRAAASRIMATPTVAAATTA